MNSRLMLIMPFLFHLTASLFEKTIHSVTQAADEVFVLIYLTVRLGWNDSGL